MIQSDQNQVCIQTNWEYEQILTLESQLKMCHFN